MSWGDQTASLATQLATGEPRTASVNQLTECNKENADMGWKRPQPGLTEAREEDVDDHENNGEGEGHHWDDDLSMPVGQILDFSKRVP